MITNKKITDVLVKARIKSHVRKPHSRKSSCRLESCHATASPILCCLHC